MVKAVSVRTSAVAYNVSRTRIVPKDSAVTRLALNASKVLALYSVKPVTITRLVPAVWAAEA